MPVLTPASVKQAKSLESQSNKRHYHYSVGNTAALYLLCPAACAQALSAAVEAISRFQSAGVSWLRPPDYYAEMVKSDEQMAKIKDRLMYEQQLIDQAAER